MRLYQGTIRNFLAGILIGIGCILPGVSGGVMAVSFGLYRPMLDAVLDFFHAPRRHLRFLSPLALGGGLGMLAGAHVLAAAIETLMDRRKYRLEEIAQMLGYTPKHMALLIKKQYGCDFRTLRRQKILEAAKIYLFSQNLSVAEIAQLLGYRSESAFYAFFKEETGVTPRAYRETVLGEEEALPYESQ